ncbi:sporulation protein, partial [Vibrio splendidus]
MFNRILAQTGFSGAKVDTVLNNSSIYQGGNVEGTVCIVGGSSDQQISKIKFFVMTQAKVESDDGYFYQEQVIQCLEIPHHMRIQAHQKHEVPFVFALPSETPITVIAEGCNQSQVWIQTELDIEFGVDSVDRDYVHVFPIPAVEMMINKFINHGFNFMKVDVEAGYLSTPSFRSTSGVYQEIEMRPAGFFDWNSRNIEEIELSFIVEGDVVHLLVEVDRHSYGDGYKSVSFPTYVEEYELDNYFMMVM